MTTDTQNHLAHQVQACENRIEDLFNAYDRDPDKWTCDDDPDCTGPDDCPAAQNIADEHGTDTPGEALDDLPLSVIYKRGRPFTIVLCTGGPHVEISGDAAYEYDMKLRGYWAGCDPVTRESETIRRYAKWWQDRMDDLYALD